MKPWLKRRKNFVKEKLRLEDEYNYKNSLRMSSETSEEIFQLIKDDRTKLNTTTRDPMITHTITCNHNRLFINRATIQESYL